MADNQRNQKQQGPKSKGQKSTDQKSTDQKQENQEPMAEFAMQRFYIKDLSFESPRTPEIFKSQWHPSADLDINTSSTPLEEEDLYEVTLSLTVTATTNKEVAFILELSLAGIFLIRSTSEKLLDRTLGIFCPDTLFPYARETVDSIIHRGSFPALMMAPINFETLYAKTRKENENKSAQ